MSVYSGDMEDGGQYAGAPAPDEAPADYTDPFHFPVCSEDDPSAITSLPPFGLSMPPFDPSQPYEPQTTMGPADPNAPRYPDGDDGPFSEQGRDLLHHPPEPEPYPTGDPYGDGDGMDPPIID